MAIDPTTTTTVKVSELASAGYNTTDLIPHEVAGILKKGNLQDLATFIGGIISTEGAVGFRAVQVNDGETLPATDEQEFILVGPGTYPNVGGGPTITTTEPLNALVSNATYWFIGVEIPITATGVWGTITGVLSDQTDLNDVLDAKADLVDGKVPNSQLPSYVDDVVEVANYEALPATGETGKIYVTIDTGNVYRWSGSAYIRIADESPVWGIITGTLSDQTDLQDALDGKFDVPTGDTTQYIAGDGSLITFPVAGQAGTLVRLVRNISGATITKGTVVYINGASGNNPTIAKAIASGDSTSAQTFGLVQADITNNSNGYVVVTGDLIGVNTSAITEGSQLYLSSTTAGAYTTTKQLAPAHLVYIGVVTRSHASLGQIEVKIQNGYELDELHDVAISSKANNEVIVYESSTDLWKNKSIATILGYTPANDASVVKLTGDQSITGQKTFNNSTVNSSIITNNSSTGYGIISSNISTGTGINSSNTGAGKGIYSDNSSTGVGIRSDNLSTGRGFYSINSGTGVGIDSNNSSSGFGIRSVNSSNGWGAILYNTSNGRNLVLDNSTAATGIPFTVSKNGTEKFTINDAGEATGVKFIKSGGTSSQFLKADGSVDSTTYQTALTNPVTGTGTSGHVAFWNGTSSITGESNLFWDSTNDRLGIGTATPAAKLSVNGDLFLTSTGRSITFNSDTNLNTQIYEISGSINLYTGGQDRMRITSGGNVGVGTSNPLEKFVVSNSGAQGLEITPNFNSTTNRILSYNRSTSAYNSILYDGLTHIWNTSSNPSMLLTTNGELCIGRTSAYGAGWLVNVEGNIYAKYDLRIDNNASFGGSVGIGTASPSVKLVVDGGSSDYTPIWAKSSLLASSKYYSSLLAGYALTANQSAQFGYVYDTVTATNSYAHITPFGSAEGSKFMVRADGNVGIGTTSPNAKLTIHQSSAVDSALALGNTVDANQIVIGKQGGTAYGATGAGDGFLYNYGSLSVMADGAGIIKFSAGGNTERMRITSGGNVGIGETNPAYKLDVKSSAFNVANFNSTYGQMAISFANSGTIFSQIGSGNSVTATAAFDDLGFGTAGLNKNIVFATGSSYLERMRITSGGEVLVNTTSSLADGVTMQTHISSDNFCLGLSTASGASKQPLRFVNGTTAVGSVTTTTTTTSYNMVSDYRLKKDYKIFKGLDKILQLKMYDFAWNSDESRMFGGIAHEIQEIVPQAVTGEKDAKEMQSVDYSKLVPILVQAIQELKQEIEILKNK